jgi:hypothetical protein
VTHGVDDQVTGGRDGGRADAIYADEMFGSKGIGVRGGGRQARKGKTNNYARHLYSSEAI